MQRVGRDGRQTSLGRGAEGREDVADVVGEVERDEEAKWARRAGIACGRRRAAARGDSPVKPAAERPQHVEGDGGRAVADVGAAARQADGALLGVRRRLTEMQTVPTGFASEPPPGPAMPVMPIP